MRLIKISRFLYFFLIYLLLNFSLAHSNTEIIKIDKQLKSIKELYNSGVFDETSYNNAKQELLDRKNKILKSNKKKKKDRIRV